MVFHSRVSLVSRSLLRLGLQTDTFQTKFIFMRCMIVVAWARLQDLENEKRDEVLPSCNETWTKDYHLNQSFLGNHMFLFCHPREEKSPKSSKSVPRDSTVAVCIKPLIMRLSTSEIDNAGGTKPWCTFLGVILEAVLPSDIAFSFSQSPSASIVYLVTRAGWEDYPLSHWSNFH